MQNDEHSETGLRAHGEARRHTRTPYSVPIALHEKVEGVVRNCHGITLDISQGGLGALISDGPQVGDVVQIEFTLGGQHFCADAVVRHKTGVRSGFEFLGLTSKERRRIAGAVGQS